MRLIAVLASAFLLLSGPRPIGPPVCTCVEAKLKGGWCRICKVGYIASIRVTSEMLFEALDAHGHDFDPARFRCETCKEAMKSQGYCETCRIGFIGGQAYLSKLTYYLAKGEPRDPAAIECPMCRKHAERHGWCEACKLGMVGNVALKEKVDYEQVAPEMDRLLEALTMLPTCESCGVAFFCRGQCMDCKKSFERPRPAAAGKSPSPPQHSPK